MSTREIHNIDINKRVGIIELKAKGFTLEQIVSKTKVKLSTVKYTLHKWKFTHRV